MYRDFRKELSQKTNVIGQKVTTKWRSLRHGQSSQISDRPRMRPKELERKAQNQNGQQEFELKPLNK